MSSVKTGQDLHFSGHFGDTLGLVLGPVPGHGPNSAFGTCPRPGQVQLSLKDDTSKNTMDDAFAIIMHAMRKVVVTSLVGAI